MGSGVVEAVGPDVAALAVGDRVVLSTGHQELVVVPESAVHRVPAGLSLRDAALSYLPSWSVSALHLGPLPGGRDGGRRRAGAGRRVGGAGRRPQRRAGPGARRRRSGDWRSPRSGSGSCRAPTRTTQGGDRARPRPAGPDLVIETTGAWGGFRQAITLARDFTRIAVMGIYRTPPPPDLGLEPSTGQLFTFPAEVPLQAARDHRLRRRIPRRRGTAGAAAPRRPARTGTTCSSRPRAAGCRWAGSSRTCCRPPRSATRWSGWRAATPRCSASSSTGASRRGLAPRAEVRQRGPPFADGPDPGSRDSMVNGGTWRPPDELAADGTARGTSSLWTFT